MKSPHSRPGPTLHTPIHRRRTRCVVDIFAGTAKIAHRCSLLGLPSESWEIARGDHQDVLLPENSQRIRLQIEKHRAGLVWFALPCQTWSRARRGGRTGPPPLRNKEFIMGRPPECLSDKDQNKVYYGNKLFHWTMSVIRHCMRHGVPFILENPRTSMVWDTPAMQKLFRNPLCSRTNLDFCQFHVPWKKATSLLSFNVPSVGRLHKQCTYRGPCTWSGVPHVVLTGTDEHGVFWTSRASPYPDLFAAKSAQVIYDTITGSKAERAARAAQVTRA